ncbi:uncharacterized protein LOC108918749 isoform X2 [Arapaima gigas]
MERKSSRHTRTSATRERGKTGAGKRRAVDADGKKAHVSKSGRLRKSIPWSKEGDGKKPFDQQTDTDKFCKSCRAPWASIHENGMERCSNQSCEVVSVLLICDTVTDPTSNVLGCPVFRACPQCCSLIMHKGGCKFVCCKTCKYRFCFICLEPTEVCAKARKLYWSTTCKKPCAERQRFVTGNVIPHATQEED